VTTKADLTDGNWAALVEAGPAIAMAVASAAGSANESAHEFDAFSGFVAETAGATAGAPAQLLGELTSDLQTRLTSGWRPEGHEALVDGLESARRAGAILDVAVDPADAEVVRTWYLTGARRVAETAKEGGLLGIGGARVSDWEADTIRAIADALGSDKLEAQ
jgi:hypothetical protein